MSIPKIQLSVIIPLYNEAKRAPSFLDQLLLYNNKKWEFIFVDDGSRDATLKLIKSCSFFNRVIITYEKNRGKGYAVKKGIEKAKGNFIIFIDADGSIHPSQIKKMLVYLKKYEFVSGSRALQESQIVLPFFRLFVGKVFNNYVKLLYNIPIDDNLCGFKGFKKEAAKKLFSNLISERWIFDVELFYKLKKGKYSMFIMPIKWSHRGNSKMKLLDMLKISMELIFLRIKLR